jgi:hypothetical protein
MVISGTDAQRNPSVHVFKIMSFAATHQVSEALLEDSMYNLLQSAKPILKGISLLKFSERMLK